MVWFHMAHFSPADNRMTSAGALTAPARQRVGCVAAVQAWRLGLAKRPSLRWVPSVTRDRPCMENYGKPDRRCRIQGDALIDRAMDKHGKTAGQESIGQCV